MKTLLLASFLIAGVGCTHMQPIGPLARGKGKPPAANLDKDVPDPVTISAPMPVPPALLIESGEVTADNASAAAQKLANEYDYDWKTLRQPKPAKGGVK